MYSEVLWSLAAPWYYSCGRIIACVVRTKGYPGRAFVLGRGGDVARAPHDQNLRVPHTVPRREDLYTQRILPSTK